MVNSFNSVLASIILKSLEISTLWVAVAMAPTIIREMKMYMGVMKDSEFSCVLGGTTYSGWGVFP